MSLSMTITFSSGISPIRVFAIIMTDSIIVATKPAIMLVIRVPMRISDYV
ncbi:MAG: hypothetical protein IH787_05235 [Nitrospirae bacterium]|nr:hypothetical protein [Nitrospirota bacterium]